MNTLKKQFSDALKREGKIITTYYKSESVKCLFRINNDNNNTDNHITIFYDVSEPIKQGMLLSYSGETYLTMNKETVENGIYYKSALRKCNVVFPVTNNGVTTNIPFYSYKLSLGLDSGKVITTIDGNGEIITEYTEAVEKIQISSSNTYNMMNRYFEVINTYNLDGIFHVILKVALTPAHKYTLELSAYGDDTDLVIGDTSQITTVCKDGTSIIIDQTITYSSSNSTIATVSSTGLVTSLTAGTVDITATWTEQNISKTISFAISQTTPVETYKITFILSGGLIIDGTRTITPTLKDSKGNTISDWTAVWTVNYGDLPQSEFTITYVGNQLKITIAEDYELIDKEISFTCTTNDNLTSATYTATISA